MGNEMYVSKASLLKLRGELALAKTNFEKSFNELESRINSITSKDFTGPHATTFKNNFVTKSKPKLDELKVSTQRAVDYMDERIAGYMKMDTALNDIVSR